MLASLRSTVTHAVSEARHSHKHLPQLRDDKAALLRWLKEARAAQIALAATVVGGLFVVGPLVDAFVDLVLPASSQQGGFLGLSRRTVENPLAGPMGAVLTLLFWAGGMGTTLVLLWRDIPRHVSQVGAEDRTMLVQPGATQGSPDATMATMVQAAVPQTTTPAAVPTTSDSPAESHTLAGRYAITRQLGEGGMGQVFLAEDRTLGRDFALKRLPAELLGHDDMRERFRREARALAQLNHAHVVQLYDFLEEQGSMWMVMEVVSGGDLEKKLETGQIDLGEVRRLGSQMAAALGAAHARGIVHRDFKPANVMLSESGEAKVTDFGIAKLETMSARADTKLTQAGTMMGTPTYMSPEQARGADVGPASDVYSLGATLYEMMTGSPLFEGTLTQVVAAHITETPRSFEERDVEVPSELGELVLSMLSKEPDARPTIDEVRRTLEPT